MKLKTSNDNSLLIIGVSALIILFLLSFQLLVRNKSSALEPQEIEHKTALNSIQISIKEKHFRKVSKKRNKALSDGILETDDNDYVPAIITYNNEDFKAKIRLKGDFTDHLQGVKWSYRIKLSGDRTILGMRKFSIHHPRTRGYINEWLFHRINKTEGLMGLRYHFVEGFLNIKPRNSNQYVNKNVGIYALEETFDKRTIESNNRKEGLFLRISEKYFWKEMKQALKIGNKTLRKPNDKRQPKFIGPANEYVATFGFGKLQTNEALKHQFVLAKNLLEAYRTNELEASKVFDVKKLALHTALNNLFGAYHGLAIINLRFYYNPTTSLLEPISYDGNAGHVISKFIHYKYTNFETDTIYRNELIKALERVSREEYLDSIFSVYSKEINRFEKVLDSEFQGAEILEKKNYIQNQSIVRRELERLNNITDDTK